MTFGTMALGKTAKKTEFCITFVCRKFAVMLSLFLLKVYTECRYAESHRAGCNHAECRYAECHRAECRGTGESE
jgi:hypothetical protein